MSTQDSGPRKPRKPHEPSKPREPHKPPAAGQGQAGTADRRRNIEPGEDPGTLTDEEYLMAGGPDAIDSATEQERPAGGESTPKR